MSAPRGAPGSKRGTSGRTVLLLRKACEAADDVMFADVPSELMNFKLPGRRQLGHSSRLQGDAGGAATAEEDAGAAVRVQPYAASTLPAELHEWCFQLVKSHLQDMYEPVWGWDDTRKRAQLRAVSGFAVCGQRLQTFECRDMRFLEMRVLKMLCT